MKHENRQVPIELFNGRICSSWNDEIIVCLDPELTLITERRSCLFVSVEEYKQCCTCIKQLEAPGNLKSRHCCATKCYSWKRRQELKRRELFHDRAMSAGSNPSCYSSRTTSSNKMPATVVRWWQPPGLVKWKRVLIRANQVQRARALSLSMRALFIFDN